MWEKTFMVFTDFLQIVKVFRAFVLLQIAADLV